ncbi:MAG TPA: phosphatase PAP2 family protein [Dehalococcoidia bacterium]|nr:phosphatase PAP2 family protein [Dehalococcoidia bacterium]
MRAVLTSRYTREPVIMVAAYLLYYMARHIADNAQPAFENAHYMMKLETSIGIFKEISLQSALLSYHALIHVFNVIYFYGHWPSIIAFGLYLFITKPQVYTITRNAFLISGAVALIFFALFPVAPPRLSTFGIVDTLSWTVPVDYDKSPLVNPYAALPSMHVGWCLLISAGLYLSTTKPLVRIIAFVITPAMWFATVITGNHFFIDGIFGTILAGISLMIALWLQRNWPTIETALRARWHQYRNRPLPALGSG